MAALPPNWREATDAGSGATYWYNEVSGESTWDRPAPPRQGSSAPRAGANADLSCMNFAEGTTAKIVVPSAKIRRLYP
jgi:hypothetical protein